MTRAALLLVGCNYSGLVSMIAVWLHLIWSQLHLIWSEVWLGLHLIWSQKILIPVWSGYDCGLLQIACGIRVRKLERYSPGEVVDFSRKIYCITVEFS